MKHSLFISFLLMLASACQEHSDKLVGKYQLELDGLKNTTNGELEVIGKPGDYFGKLTLFASRERTFEVGLEFEREDSLSFFMPGKGGFLRLVKRDSIWVGDFKYFGLKAKIIGKKVGDASQQLKLLTHHKPLAIGVISTSEEESFPSFDPDAQTLYFSRGGQIFFSKFSNSAWTEPRAISFSQDFNDSAPSLAPDGQSLLFSSNRPLPNTTFKKKNLWISHRENETWGEPNPLPTPINIDSLGDYHGAIAGNGNYYFVSYNRENGYGRSDLYTAVKKMDGSYQVMNIGESINTENSEADVFIAPDESYLLFASTSRDDSYGADDIYISFRDGDSWSAPKNLGPSVNSFAYEYGAWVDQKSGYLYFNSYRRGTSDIYRILLKEIKVFREILN